MSKIKVTEKLIQSHLMNYLLYGKKHHSCITNSKDIVRYEADLLSITKSMYMHEYEIKISKSDYKADFKKEWKHNRLKGALNNKNIHYTTPNYFYYLTYNMDINPPEYAGWISFSYKRNKNSFTIKKKAPLLHRNKVADNDMSKMARLLSFRLMNLLE